MPYILVVIDSDKLPVVLFLNFSISLNSTSSSAFKDTCLNLLTKSELILILGFTAI